MGLFIMASGLATKSTAMEFKNGLMGPGMKACGGFLRLAAKANFGTSTAIFLKASGLTTKRMATEFIRIQMELVTLATGKTICSTARVKSTGWTEASILETTARARSMAMGSIGGLMAALIKGTG